MWDTLFSVTNAVAMLGWAVLAFAPRTEGMRRLVLFVPVALLCATYFLMFVGLFGGFLDPEATVETETNIFTDYSVDAILAAFQSRGGVVIGWTHYLAFDLFVGWWIAGEADRIGVSRVAQVPILFATLMAGPIGLLIFLALRAARKEPA